MPKRILEIGAAQLPLHDRGGLDLKEDESYTVIDQNVEIYNSAIWDKLKGKYGDRIEIKEGDLENLPGEPESLDEIVSLGSNNEHNRERLIEQASKLLKKGGILVIGFGITPKDNIADFLDTWNRVFREYGFRHLREERKTYNYSAELANVRSDFSPDEKIEYAVLRFEKL